MFLGIVFLVFFIIVLVGCDSSVFASLTGCPQLNISMTLRCPESMPCLLYDGDIIADLTNQEYRAQSNSYVNCRGASLEGENKNYLYCDVGGRIGHINTKIIQQASGFFDSTYEIERIPFVVKVPKEEGDVIQKQELVRKSFTNIYSKEDSVFIKTICGKDPVEIVKERQKEKTRQYKERVGQIGSFFE